MPKFDGVGLPVRAVPMRVVVCGLHRTGTMSMRTALRQLGFHDCYHMVSTFEHIDEDPQQWIRAFEAKYAGKGSFTKADWDRLLGQCQACCDMPPALFSAELAELYPEAKVVILNRDPDKWYESVLESVNKVMMPSSLADKLSRLYIFLFNPQMRNWIRFSLIMSSLAIPFDHAKERDKAIAWFNERYAEFRERIPADRRIEYSIKDGWSPLCEHLGVPVPMVEDEQTGRMVEAPFPHVNDRASFTINAKRHNAWAMERANANLFTMVGRLCVMGALGWGGYLAWKTRLGG
ncbi:hypothetical protein TOPH_05355 [Tolypocladium ophioglossoides CBS 100239]|uniref:NAD dependent epimerase/dehydratase n=1 Tax=Tolypocladium ophioglossoides (strain CBS 100239) TaxID=1163406 RepID=A0A0L0N7R7_TOLOC|nr:hypothetical protein TOPH_05355 [Tolypocladium ophioglossoides CBS 100239]